MSTTLAAAALAATMRLVASHEYAAGAPPGFSGGFKEESCHACHFRRRAECELGTGDDRGRSGDLHTRQHATRSPITLTARGIKLGGFQLDGAIRGGRGAGRHDRGRATPTASASRARPASSTRARSGRAPRRRPPTRRGGPSHGLHQRAAARWCSMCLPMPPTATTVPTATSSTRRARDRRAQSRSTNARQGGLSPHSGRRSFSTSRRALTSVDSWSSLQKPKRAPSWNCRGNPPPRSVVGTRN